MCFMSIVRLRECILARRLALRTAGNAPTPPPPAAVLAPSPPGRQVDSIMDSAVMSMILVAQWRLLQSILPGIRAYSFCDCI
mmetsp:Transcript_42991/g.71274  ORF Transcript_42991/g.71274 Transcript_42991/m.71274 type:complete len:82 (+) Transcript_42991:1005-1250(+)